MELGLFAGGAHQLGLGQEAASALVGQAFEAGINFIDTANVYSGTKSETIVGKAVKGLGLFELAHQVGNHAARNLVLEMKRVVLHRHAERQAVIVSAPENVKKQMLLDFDYWADHLVEAQERFDDFLQQ
mgnify:CR=1 FL=1